MILTTVTPYWNRPEQLRAWLAAIRGAQHPEVHHLLYVLGDEPLPPEVRQLPIQVVRHYSQESHHSIGYFHNLGASEAGTEWMMKMDVDALPNPEYFNALVDVLRMAGEREWFNGGMFYVTESVSRNWLSGSLTMGRYFDIMRNRVACSSSSYSLPASSNFICRRGDYLNLGGCDERFKGWGWEDYQQIYMLERFRRGDDPLPGPVSLMNVTQRCRDEISRPKAKVLWEHDSRLCLIHRWHPASMDPSYRSFQAQNKRILFDYITRARMTDNTPV